MYADVCRICGGYSNAGFDICEDCCKKQVIKEIIEMLKSKEIAGTIQNTLINEVLRLASQNKQLNSFLKEERIKSK